MGFRQADEFVKEVFGGWGWYIGALASLYPATLAGQWLANQL